MSNAITSLYVSKIRIEFHLCVFTVSVEPLGVPTILITYRRGSIGVHVIRFPYITIMCILLCYGDTDVDGRVVLKCIL
jgi:hypothetical protein